MQGFRSINMAGREAFTHLVVVFIVHFCHVCSTSEVVIEYSEDNKKPCTYFESTRCAEEALGLVNCSWYVPLACCKRTEVTSVFASNMLPLYDTSKDCQNRINYMMCFFCSPDQERWYKEGKVHICNDFCTDAHKYCRDAFHNGKKLGDVYKNGTAFCEAQNFEVVNSKYCFKYDPTVFDSSTPLTGSIYTCFIMFLIATVFNNNVHIES